MVEDRVIDRQAREEVVLHGEPVFLHCYQRIQQALERGAINVAREAIDGTQKDIEDARTLGKAELDSVKIWIITDGGIFWGDQRAEIVVRCGN